MVSWVKNIFCLYLFVSFILQLLLNDKYKKYIKLFAGVIMILLVLGPVSGLLTSQNEQKQYFENVFEWDDTQQYTYKMLLEASGDSYDLVLDEYTDEIVKQIDSLIAEYGYKVSEQDISFNLDEQNEYYGKIEKMKLGLVPVDESLVKSVIIEVKLEDESQNNREESCEEIIIKNKLANFYSIAACNININIYE